LHHLDNIAGTLSEMARVLKPGGWFLLREMFRDNENEKMITDTMQHDWFAEIDMVLGRNHFPTLTKQGIIDLVDSLGLRKVEMRERLCDNCPRSRGEKKDEEIADMDEQLEKIKGYPKYDGFKKRRDVIVERLLTIGIACSTQLDIVGIK
jgi:SAM-dependent methyltransferase